MTAPSAVFRRYPTVCTNTVWQKHKSFTDKAKAKTKTGLGETLKTAEKAWLKIPWTALEAKKLKAATLKDAQSNKTKALKAVEVVNAAKTALANARDKALETKDNTALSANARRQAEVIANGLKSSLGWLDKVNTDDFDQEITRLGG